MKFANVPAMLALVAGIVSGPVIARTSCEILMAEIETKIKDKGVKAFTLTIVPTEAKTDLRVVGTCDGGTKKIIYKRG